jgi:hypothetical protein
LETKVKENKMKNKKYRGSRKHILDWTNRPDFTSKFTALLSPIPVKITTASKWMPQGIQDPKETRIETFGPKCIPSHPAWTELKDWWLIHQRGANTPNWDIAVCCKIEGRPGFVLAEAKANRAELKDEGKKLSETASRNSRENHQQIGRAIGEACAGWQLIDSRVNISHESHYQLANRLAYTWKLGMFGFPIVLVYLGFIGDEGIRDVGDPFADEEDWNQAFSQHAHDIIPIELFDKRIDLGPAPIWLVIRSRPVL